MADLSVEILGLRFPTPVVAGAGPHTGSGDGLISALDGGAGALFTRTISLRPPSPPPEPAIVPFGRDGFLSLMAPSAAAPEEWVNGHFPTVAAVAEAHGVPFVASLTGTADEVALLGPRLVKAGAKALEYATAYQPWPQAMRALESLRRSVTVPVIAKLNLAHGEDIAERALAVESIVDGFTCMGAFGPVLDVDVESGGRPRLGGPQGFGWMSGRPVHPIAVRAVFEVARAVKKPVIASGGAFRHRDVVEFLQVGASLVQVTTAALVKGAGIYSALSGGLNTWLNDHAVESVPALTGRYLRRFGHGQRVVLSHEESPVLLAERCARCGICEDVCYFDAIVSPKGSLPEIHASHCFQCGLCVSACPPGALSFRPREEVTMLPPT